MSQSAVKASRRAMRRAIGETGVDMLDELQICVGKLEARCDALERLARLQRDAREALESRMYNAEAKAADLARQSAGHVDVVRSLTLVGRLWWLLTGKVA